MGVASSVRTDEPVAALTFDDGPDPVSTPRVLDLLDAYDAKGTFFVIGRQAVRHPEIVDRMRTTGHALGNHTWSHRSLPRLSRTERRRELARAMEALRDGERLMRPPYGHFDLASWYDARTLGLRPVTWSGNAKDWALTDPQELMERMRAQMRPGAILLLHDRLNEWECERFVDRGPMLAALEALLEAMRGEMRFVTVPDLFTRGRVVRRVRWRRGDDAWLDGLQRAPDG